MHRLFAFFAALILTTITVSSACTASPSGQFRFTLEPARTSDRIQASFRSADRNTNQWSSDMPVREFAGLDLARLRAAGTGPLNFAVVREAGRLDCAGNGGNSTANGSCTFTADRGFHALLASRGIERPDADEAFAMMAVDVRRQIVDALSAARYPTPDVDDLISLTAVGVTDDYIRNLARVGYRPATLDALLQFRALNITPEFIQGFVRLGYGGLPADQLVQLKALDIGAEFVARFERIGYGRLPIDDLVQLKALGITPDFVAGFQRIGYQKLPVSKLVELKAVGVTPEFIRSMQLDGEEIPSAGELARRRSRSR